MSKDTRKRDYEIETDQYGYCYTIWHNTHDGVEVDLRHTGFKSREQALFALREDMISHGWKVVERE